MLRSPVGLRGSRDDRGGKSKRSLTHRVERVELPEIAEEEVQRVGDPISRTSNLIYRGLWRGSDVVLKFVHKSTTKEHKDFVQQCKILALVSGHSHIVRFLGVGLAYDSLFVMTQWYAGGTLASFRQSHERNPLSRQQTRRLAGDVASGLLHLHREGIVHRNLTGENVLLDLEMRGYVNDFAGSLVLQSMGDLEERTQKRTGTSNWSAPQCFLNPFSVSFSNDVWSFGSCLYELVAWKAPYEGLNPTESMLAILNPEVSLPLPQDADPLLVELLRQCHRFASQDRPNMLFITQHIRENQDKD